MRVAFRVMSESTHYRGKYAFNHQPWGRREDHPPSIINAAGPRPFAFDNSYLNDVNPRSRFLRSIQEVIRRFAQIGENEALEFEAGTTEVQEQAPFQRGGFELVEQVSFVIAREGLRCLELHDEVFIAHEIGPILAG